MINTLSVAAAVLFGCWTHYRYWRQQASATIGPGDRHESRLQQFVLRMLSSQAASDLPPGRAGKPAKATHGERSRIERIVDHLAAAVAEIPQEFASDDSPRFRLVVEGAIRPVHEQVRDEAFQIAREAICNAFRHAAALAVEAEIIYGKGRLRIRIRDDGRGFEPAIARDPLLGNRGMREMRARAAGIGGKLEVWSGLHLGTEVQLEVPGSVAYEDYRPRTGLGIFRLVRGSGSRSVD